MYQVALVTLLMHWLGVSFESGGPELETRLGAYRITSNTGAITAGATK